MCPAAALVAVTVTAAATVVVATSTHPRDGRRFSIPPRRIDASGTATTLASARATRTCRCGCRDGTGTIRHVEWISVE